MGEFATLPRNVKKPGSYFQNLNRAGSFRDNCLSITAKIMKIGPVERWN